MASFYRKLVPRIIINEASVARHLLRQTHLAQPSQHSTLMLCF